MSWHYLQGREGAYFRGGCLDGAPDALLKLIPTQEECFCQDREMGASTGSQYGTTSEHSTGLNGADQLTLFLEDSPAKTSAQPEVEKGYPDNVADYGLRCFESLKKLNLALSSPKTLNTSVSVDSAPLSKDLTGWGMTFDGACWALGTSVRLTKETGCGYLLATPTTQSNQLCPGMQKWKGCKAWVTHFPEVNEVGGLINPMWIEWMMGWPIGWTDLKPLEMDKYQQWQQKHSRYFRLDGSE